MQLKKLINLISNYTLMINLVLVLIIFFLIYLILRKKGFKEGFKNKKKTLVSYVYYETEYAKNNLKFFIDNGIFKSNDVDFYITINGYKCSLDIPEYKNVKILRKKNKCYDIGRHGEIISKINKNNYKYFVFLNSSIRGPYTKNNESWVDIFTSKINNLVKLVGVNKSDWKNLHIQSMLFATDRIGLDIILPSLTCKKNHDDAVNNGELKISKLITDRGFKLDSMINTHFEMKKKGINRKNRYKSIFYKTHWRNKLL